MKLAIYTPEKMYFSGEVEVVTLPGLTGSFTILDHHAALISSLGKGSVMFRGENGVTDFLIESGFVEVKKNEVIVCTELMNIK
jgi:F-type H+-transporting ATPase subunit epsilon